MMDTTQFRDEEHDAVANGFRTVPAVITGSLVLLFFMSILYVLFSGY